MKAKDVLTNIPAQCKCEVKESGKSNGKVKGYICIKQCLYCKNKAKEENIQAEKDKEQQEIAIMIAEKAREMAKDQLIKEGILEEIDGKLRKK
jgi:hypothetical protein